MDNKTSEITYEKMVEDINEMYSIFNTIGGVVRIQQTEKDLEPADPKKVVSKLKKYKDLEISYTKRQI